MPRDDIRRILNQSKKLLGKIPVDEDNDNLKKQAKAFHQFLEKESGKNLNENELTQLESVVNDFNKLLQAISQPQDPQIWNQISDSANHLKSMAKNKTKELDQEIMKFDATLREELPINDTPSINADPSRLHSSIDEAYEDMVSVGTAGIDEDMKELKKTIDKEVSLANQLLNYEKNIQKKMSWMGGITVPSIRSNTISTDTKNNIAKEFKNFKATLLSLNENKPLEKELLNSGNKLLKDCEDLLDNKDFRTRMDRDPALANHLLKSLQSANEIAKSPSGMDEKREKELIASSEKLVKSSDQLAARNFRNNVIGFLCVATAIAGLAALTVFFPPAGVAVLGAIAHASGFLSGGALAFNAHAVVAGAHAFGIQAAHAVCEHMVASIGIGIGAVVGAGLVAGEMMMGKRNDTKGPASHKEQPQKDSITALQDINKAFNTYKGQLHTLKTDANKTATPIVKKDNTRDDSEPQPPTIIRTR